MLCISLRECFVVIAPYFVSFKVAKELFGATIHHSEVHDDEAPEAYKISNEEKWLY